MIPTRLIIKGLYSYQEQQTIDFRKLSASSLFGIFGNVGSGKSAILEAITYALYGNIERLNNRENRAYNMLNLKSSKLYIELEFEAGNVKKEYKSVVSGRRNSKKFDDVNLDRKAYQNIAGEWSPIEASELERAIGLSYENFKRTIIIPQGKFQDFLQLKSTDRTKMMKELFNLQKFELSGKTTALETENNAILQTLSGQLQQLGEIDPEQIKQLQTDLNQLRLDTETKNKKLLNHQSQEKIWADVKERMEKLLFIKKQQAELKAQAPIFHKLEQSILRYEQCHFNFKSLMDAAKTSQLSLKTKQTQLAADALRFEKEQKEILVLEEEVRNLKPAYENREKLKKQEQDLSHILKIKNLSIELDSLKSRIQKGKKMVDDQISAGVQLKKQQTEQELKLSKTKTLKPDLALLSEVKTWYTINNGIQQKQNEIAQEIIQQNKENNLLQESLKTLLKDPCFAHQSIPTGEAATLVIGQRKNVIEKENQLNDKEIEHLRVQQKLESYAGELKDGEACPLCGALDHPQLILHGNLENALQKCLKEKEKATTEMLHLDQILRQINELETRFKMKIEALDLLKRKQKGNAAEAQKHLQTFKWDNYGTEEKVKNGFAKEKEMQEELQRMEGELKLNAGKLEANQSKKEEFQQVLAQLETSSTQFKTEISTLQSQLQLLKLELYNQIPPEEIDKQKNQLALQFQELEKSFTLKTTLLTNKQQTVATLKGSIESQQREINEETLRHQALNSQLEQKLKASEFQNLKEIESILSQHIELDQEKEKLKIYTQKCSSLENQLNLLEKEIGDRTYDQEKHQELILEIDRLKLEIDGMNKEFGRKDELLKKLEKDRKNQAELLKKKEKVQLRAENIRTLKLLFKASGFVNYISSVYLQNLCKSANERFFKLTRQKLSLELTEDNNFQVRDFMNGGKVRSIKTLSGGQTFQAALSLALALSDNVQHLAGADQNFFFLDEGFGSLDRESLSIVFDTLKTLHKENRIVGLISHVEEMQQDVSTFLRITNHAETGSIVQASWEM